MPNVLWLVLVIAGLAGHPNLLLAADEGAISDRGLDEPALVTIDPSTHSAMVRIDGAHFTTLNVSPEQRKPYFAPLLTAGGQQITRTIGDATDNDHPHHTGVWASVDEVAGSKHWMGRERIVNQSWEVEVASGNPARLKLVNHWLNAAGEPVLIETTRVSIFAHRLMAFDIELAAANGDVHCEDTKEGFFGLRLTGSLREKVGGVVVNAEGRRTTAECWGRPSPWVDYSGVVDGTTVGVALFDHPANFRPSRYHVRDYGLFTVSPFGEGAYQNDAGLASPVLISAGSPLRLQYGLYVHEGDSGVGKVAATFEQYAQPNSTP